tara:strand:- start:114 stop:1469 length:1356 start_codon:yes stop_codon:yes gene_type:complete
MALETIPDFPEGPFTTSSELFGQVLSTLFPNNPLPDNGIYNITQCIGGGIDLNQSPDPNGFGGVLIDFDGANYLNNFQPLLIDFSIGRDFTSQNLSQISPIPIQETVTFNGVDQYNCSLFNRAFQAKTLIISESTSGLDYIFYGDSLNPILTDKPDPVYVQDLISIPIEEIPPNSGSVYESAYFYNNDHYYKGVNILDNEQLTYTPNAEGILDINNNDETSPVSPYNDESGFRWVIQNQNGNHEDWSYTHSSTPNGNSFISFNEDHWWVYDFGENNSKIINKVKMFFTLRTQNRHNLVEISGSNNPNIFSTNPNTANITGDQWDGLGVIVGDSSDINGFGGVNTTFNNITPYRWYKINFKGGFFQDDVLSLSEIEFYENNLNIPQIKMSDFYGLHLIDTIPDTTPNGFNEIFKNTPSYNSGHRIGVLRTDENGDTLIPQIKLGGGPQNPLS